MEPSDRTSPQSPQQPRVATTMPRLSLRRFTTAQDPQLAALVRERQADIVGGPILTDAEPGTHLALWDDDADTLVGSVHVGPAAAPMQELPLASRMFTQPSYRAPELAQLLTYLALREARIAGQPLLLQETGGETQRLGATSALFQAQGWELVRGASTQGREPRQGAPYRCVTAVADVDRTSHTVWRQLPRAMQEWTADRLFADELEQVVRSGCSEFHRTSFFQRTLDGTLGRDQYIASVANNHQFVRWTTRLLARVVGVTQDRNLRRHYIEHLKGEIDHEVLLENDLRQLGADVEFVKSHMAPSPHILQFMAIQESIAAFHRNPILFLAVPLSVESASAFLTAGFMEALKRCIAGWGIATPGRACTFLTSHINTDGGDDGHWEATRRMLTEACRSDDDLQHMCAISRAIMNALTLAYDSYGARSTVARAPWGEN
jgi:hypothetical protein